MRDRCKNGSPRLRMTCLPQINHDWLSCGQPLEPICRNWKIFRADIFTEREQRVMSPQIIEGRFYTLVDLDLLNPWIAFNIKNTIRRKQVVVEFLRTADVQDRVGIAIKLSNLLH